MCQQGVWRSKEKNNKKILEDKIIKTIEDKIIKDIKNLFEQEENYYKPVRVGNFYSNNYIEYENNGNKIKALSIKEYLDEGNHTWKISAIPKSQIHVKFN